MRKFVFTWYKNSDKCERHNIITLSKGYPNIGLAAKNATDIFMLSFGNLKKNTIVSIQEIDVLGEPIGEPIIPDDDSAIVPTVK